MTAFQFRHPELVSGSILPLSHSVSVEGWMLKQVQHDDDGEAVRIFSAFPGLRVNQK